MSTFTVFAIKFSFILNLKRLKSYQLGLELTKLGGSEDPLEGTNVTLICRSWNESLRWYEINGEFGKSEILNIIHSLKGLEETHVKYLWLMLQLLLFY